MPRLASSSRRWLQVLERRETTQVGCPSLARFRPHMSSTIGAAAAMEPGQRYERFAIPAEACGMQCGEVLPEGANLVYKRLGKLSPQKDNVILHPTSFDANHEDLLYNVGPGRLLDTDRYHVVIVNLVGNGMSISPSNTGAPLPLVTLSDNVRLQRLLLDSLGLATDNSPPLALVYGYSMGAMQALQWGCLFPEKVARIAAVCGAARCGAFNTVFLESLRAAAAADASFQPAADTPQQPHGSVGWFAEPHPPRALHAFARVYAGWGLSPEFYRKELWRQSSRDGIPFSSLEDFLHRSYDLGFAGSNINNLFAQTYTWQAGDISRNEQFSGDLGAALAAITARTLVMPCSTDRYFTEEEVRDGVAMMDPARAMLAPIVSDWGHRAGDPHRPGQEADAEYLRQHVHDLLARLD